MQMQEKMANHTPKKSRTFLLVSIILSWLCLLCVGAGAGYYLFWIQPKANLENDLEQFGKLSPVKRVK